jgi:hypothetical protein
MNLPKIVPHDQWLDARKGCPHLDRSAAQLKVTGRRPVNSVRRPDLYRRTVSHRKEPR